MNEPQMVDGLVGQLLVASPALGDPTFTRSVILLLDHDEAGALGVVINRPTPVDVADVPREARILRHGRSIAEARAPKG